MASTQFYPDKVTPKEAAFVEHFIESGNISQSVIKAGYGASSMRNASVQGNQLLKRPRISRYWQEKCAKLAVTDDKALISLGRALDAKKIIRNKDGERIDEEHDHAQQVGAAVHVLRIYGAFEADRSSGSNGGQNKGISLHFDGNDQDLELALRTGRTPKNVTPAETSACKLGKRTKHTSKTSEVQQLHTDNKGLTGA